MARHRAQGADQRGRFEARDEGGMVPGIHCQAVGDEEQVEFSSLRDASNGLQHWPAAVARGRPVIAPSRRVVPGTEHEHPEMHLALGCGHAVTSPIIDPDEYSWRV